MPLQVEQSRVRHVHVIKVAGAMDASNMGQVKTLLVEIREKEEQPAVLIDLAGLDLISSMGWAMFINFAIEFKKAGGAMKFAAMNDRVERLFWLMGVNTQVENFKEVIDALKSYFSGK